MHFHVNHRAIAFEGDRQLRLQTPEGEITVGADAFIISLGGASWPQLWGMALLCGIGFTMSLFIAGLAFPTAPILIEEAKLGVLGGSVIAAIAGIILLKGSKANHQ